jgi:hypothetical protein
MDGSHEGETRVTVNGTADESSQAALASLCAAVERAVQAYRPAGVRVREVVVTVEEGGTPLPMPEVTPVYVDVYDSGYGHGI